MLEDEPPFCLFDHPVGKMPKQKKKPSGMANLPNYSNYDYADELPPFSEHDRILKSDLPSLVCYHNYQTERKLNQFTDDILNDHLYMIYHKKNLETPKLIRKLVIFLICHYKILLSKKAHDYLDSKKLTIDEWLNSVCNNQWGDILCLFFLSIVTGQHTYVHLKNGHMWSTLRSVPLDHDIHVSMCDLHLVYLGFGAFLHLVLRPAVDIKEQELPILGHVIGVDPSTNMELIKKAIKKEKIAEPTNKPATAAVGSAEQLPRVESELNMPPTKFPDSSSTQNPQTPEESQAVCKPLSVSLTRLSKEEIMKYQCANIHANLQSVSSVKPCKIIIWKLALRYGQTVLLKQPSQHSDECKMLAKKPSHKATKALPKCMVKQAKPHIHIFSMRKHILKKWHTKAYLKCRVLGCCMNYVTFNTMRNVTAHHRLHHPAITYKCSRCAKIAPTPNSL